MQHVREIFEIIGEIIDWIGIGILLVGAFQFVVQYLYFEFKRLRGGAPVGFMRRLRIDLGGYILLALEFMIISDIIHSSLSQTLDDLMFLGGIVVIRTALSYFLGRELREADDEDEDESGTNGHKNRD